MAEEREKAPTKAELYQQVDDLETQREKLEAKIGKLTEKAKAADEAPDPEELDQLRAENEELRERISHFESNQKAAAKKPARRLTHTEMETLKRHDGDLSVLDKDEA